jgi:magnesium-transporting ATPase (P-type)
MGKHYGFRVGVYLKSHDVPIDLSGAIKAAQLSYRSINNERRTLSPLNEVPTVLQRQILEAIRAIGLAINRETPLVSFSTQNVLQQEAMGIHSSEKHADKTVLREIWVALKAIAEKASETMWEHLTSSRMAREMRRVTRKQVNEICDQVDEIEKQAYTELGIPLQNNCVRIKHANHPVKDEE